MAIKILSQEVLHEELSYNPETGIFMWKKRAQGRKLDRPCGSVQTNGYLQIRVLGRSYLSHRLAWMYTHGCIDDNLTIDHINGVRDDNRICNLRLVTHSENVKNNKCVRMLAAGKIIF